MSREVRAKIYEIKLEQLMESNPLRLPTVGCQTTCRWGVMVKVTGPGMEDGRQRGYHTQEIMTSDCSFLLLVYKL